MILIIKLNFCIYFVDADKGLSQERMKDLAINASDKVYEQDDLGPVQSIKNSLGFILTQVTQVSQFLQDNEYNITTSNKNEEKVGFSLILFLKVLFNFLCFSHCHQLKFVLRLLRRNWKKLKH